MLLLLPQRYIFSSKSQQISNALKPLGSCCCYHKGTYFQANHNQNIINPLIENVVVATTKVHIFKQITTYSLDIVNSNPLLLLPQRYIFSSKSQRYCWCIFFCCVVVATTKVHIFKQITTIIMSIGTRYQLLLLPQRYIFSSKSQQVRM